MSEDKNLKKELPHNQEEFEKLIADSRERIKELSAINQTTAILHEGKSVEETLHQIVMILPPAWQYPEYTRARIRYDKKEYSSPDFAISKWKIAETFETIDGIKGFVEIFYVKEFIELDEGPFLKEERYLLKNLASLITGYLNSLKAKTLYVSHQQETDPKILMELESITGFEKDRKLLQKFLNKSNSNRDIYHDLMPFKVKEILLVSNLYDAYSIEKEGRFSEHVLGEYQQLSLTSIPRITGVSSPIEAFEMLKSKHFDMIIIMMGADKKSPIAISKVIKKSFPYIPIFLLLNSNSDIAHIWQEKMDISNIDRIFVWNGESKVFFAMIKQLEDKINTENDVRVGLVRIILLVEDSPRYYSRYLPMLYNIVLEQTRRIIDDVSTDELYKVLRLRARPKILLASTYEEARQIIDKYHDFMLSLITDVRFNMEGKKADDAGFQLVKYVRQRCKDLPVIIQSSEPSYVDKAYEYKATFINKNSDSLIQDFKSFISHYLGFGNFIYRNSSGNQIAVAKSLKEFEAHLKSIPDESLIYHAKKDHFSSWLMARGEIQVAKIINPAKVSDFKSPTDLREYLMRIIQEFRNEQNKGKVIPFEESAISDESNIVMLSDGALGGKGRGIAFINTLIHNFDFSQLVPNINIRTPKTSIIGTEEYEYFIERNRLHDLILNEKDYEVIKDRFLNSTLTDTLIRKLKVLLKYIRKPLAVRSSGLLEDSLYQPFAGIFETYLVPNNHPDLSVRLKQLMDAIRLVFASVFSKTARGYIEAIHYKIEDEKMAVIIQEVAGNQYDEYFYPHISGVAQSYNYYPFAHMKPEEGFAVTAVGLGKHVVEGEKAYRFSPQYPSTEISSPGDQYKNSQLDFYAVDLSKKNLDFTQGDMAGLKKLDIMDAEKHGNLKHCASVYDIDNDRMIPGINKPGPRVINFANILKYNYIPLDKTISTILDIVKESMGAAVEIEYAIDLNKDSDFKASFYLLQIKPLIGNAMDYEVDMNTIKKDDIILFSDKAMGNGVIEGIQDVIYIDRDVFDRTLTMEMMDEIELLNKKMQQENRKYLLIGPGRWGTRDRFIGIPVSWPQISNAQIIVETSLKDFPLDASSGSHFFHNVTSMNVGYMSIQPEISKSYLHWNKLSEQKLIEQTRFFRHVRFKKNLLIKMDGRKRIAVIST